MSATLKLIQINIESSKHLEKIIPFLKAQNPDVITLQELMEEDLKKFEEELGMVSLFTPQAIQNGGPQGVGILSKTPFVNSRITQYGGVFTNEIPVYIHNETDRLASYNTSKFMLLVAEVEKDGEVFKIATTHFPVSVGGKTSDFQRQDLVRLLPLLEQEGELVLAGDFNAPRGGEIFSALASKYADNIPPEYIWSIDRHMHRAGPMKLEADAQAAGFEGFMVDGIFSTPGYSVSNIEIHPGISDHCGFSAEISKARK
jgi:endonuclease/exonuclease/phosphatase family metal-dependent hydrolase